MPMTTRREVSGRARRTGWAAAIAGVFLGVAAPGRAAAQTLQGRVVDTSTQAAVAGATLQLLTADSAVVVAGLSGDGGAFALTSPTPGEFLLRVERIGYQTSVVGPVRLRARGFLEVTVALGVAALPVEGVNVAVEARTPFLESAGFYDRRQKLGGGQFLDRGELEKLHLEKMGSVMQTFRGVRVIRNTGEADVQLRGAVLSAMSGSVNCLPPVFIDGVLIAPQAPPYTGPRPNFDDLLTEDIEAIEVYVGQSTVPAQFARDSAPCGAIALWRHR